MFEIKSTASDLSIRFSGRTKDKFTLELAGGCPSAKLEVYTYTDELGLCRLLQEIGAADAPWAGVKSWESLEGELAFGVTCSNTGLIHFLLVMAERRGGREEWNLTACVEQDFGALWGVAREAEKFWGVGI